MENLKFYKVIVERGHMGVGKSLETVFYFRALNAYHAMCLAKKMPSVKHSRTPLKTVEITEEEYYEGMKVSPYHKEGQEIFKSKNSKYNSKKNKTSKKYRPINWF